MKRMIKLFGAIQPTEKAKEQGWSLAMQYGTEEWQVIAEIDRGSLGKVLHIKYFDHMSPEFDCEGFIHERQISETRLEEDEKHCIVCKKNEVIREGIALCKECIDNEDYSDIRPEGK
jgi:hypothetical protein